MNRQEIWKGLESVIEESSAEEIEWSEVSEETAIESFGFDSLAILDLIFDLEQEFDVQIAAEEMLEMTTMKELVDFLAERTS